MGSEQDKDNAPSRERETFAVSPVRLAFKAVNGEVCEGDIHASYSADVIAMSGRVRKPFRWKGGLCVCTSITGSGLTDSGTQEHEAYRLVPLAIFRETTTTYRNKTATAEASEAARNDPNGFYHGMSIQHGKADFVLCGPPIKFVPELSPERPDSVIGDDPLQLSLF